MWNTQPASKLDADDADVLGEESLIAQEPIAPWENDDEDPRRSFRVRLIVTVSIAVFLTTIGFGFVWFIGNLLDSLSPTPTKTTARTDAALAQRDRYVRALQRERDQFNARSRSNGSRRGAPAVRAGADNHATGGEHQPAIETTEGVGAVESTGLATSTQATSRQQQPHRPSTRNSRRKRSTTAADAKTAQSDATKTLDPLEQLYGSRERYRKRMRTRSRSATTQKTDAKPVDVEGIRMKVRLIHDVASTPANAPIVAKVRTRLKLGEHVVPPGSEVHGSVTGGQEGRVFAIFRFIKRKDGKKIDIQGVARGDRGRVGIRAAKTLTEESGASVGQEAAAGALRGVSGALGATGIPGRVVGGAIDGTVSKTEEKIKAVDNDHIIAIATKGEPFEIYITALGSDP